MQELNKASFKNREELDTGIKLVVCLGRWLIASTGQLFGKRSNAPNGVRLFRSVPLDGTSRKHQTAFPYNGAKSFFGSRYGTALRCPVQHASQKFGGRAHVYDLRVPGDVKLDAPNKTDGP